MGDVVMFTGTLVRVPPQSAPCRIVPIPIRERTDLGCYRASLRYDDLRVMLVRALSAATLGGDPVAAARAIEFMRHVAEFSEDFRARSLAREYLGYVGRAVSL